MPPRPRFRVPDSDSDEAPNMPTDTSSTVVPPRGRPRTAAIRGGRRHTPAPAGDDREEIDINVPGDSPTQSRSVSTLPCDESLPLTPAL